VLPFFPWAAQLVPRQFLVVNALFVLLKSSQLPSVLIAIYPTSAQIAQQTVLLLTALMINLVKVVLTVKIVSIPTLLVIPVLLVLLSMAVLLMGVKPMTTLDTVILVLTVCGDQ